MKIQLKKDLFLEKKEPVIFGDAYYQNDENANMFEKQYSFIIQRDTVLDVKNDPYYTISVANLKAFAKKDCYNISIGNENVFVKLKEEDFLIYEE